MLIFISENLAKDKIVMPCQAEILVVKSPIDQEAFADVDHSLSVKDKDFSEIRNMPSFHFFFCVIPPHLIDTEQHCCHHCMLSTLLNVQSLSGNIAGFVNPCEHSHWFLPGIVDVVDVVPCKRNPIKKVIV